MALGIASQLVDGDIRHAIGLGGVDVSKDHGVGRIVLTDLGKRRGAGFDVAKGTGTVVDIGLKADEVGVDGVGHGPLLHEGVHLDVDAERDLAELADAGGDADHQGIGLEGDLGAVLGPIAEVLEHDGVNAAVDEGVGILDGVLHDLFLVVLVGSVAGKRQQVDHADNFLLAIKKQLALFAHCNFSFDDFGQHRTIQRAHSARDFLSRQGLKSAGILCVFQSFRTEGSAKNIRRRPKM